MTKIELEEEVVEEIKNGNKIAAIKKLRELRGLGLKDAKDLIDLFSSQNNISTHPVENSSAIQRAGSSNGILLAIIICVISYFIYTLVI